MHARIRPEWLSFSRFAAFTTGLTLTLMMLGVYTAATGSGLACSAQWPLCDNGLLPQTVPSFIEWFHRLVAMITGFFILGTAVWAWRRSNRGETLAATAALVALPVQVSIGAVTVTLSGLLPGGYAVPTHAAHLFAALFIFVGLTLTTLFAVERHTGRSPAEPVRRALLVGGAALLASALLSRVGPVLSYTPAAQAMFTGATLVAIAALVAATYWAGPVSRVRRSAALALALVVFILALGRDLVFYSASVEVLNAAAYLLAFALLAAAIRLLSGSDRRSRLTDASRSN